MPQILIEENFKHIDGLDMEALIAAFADQGVDAEPTPQQTNRKHKGGGWELVLHWLGNENLRHTVEAATFAVVDDVRALYRIKRNGVGEGPHRTPPVRIGLYGPDGGIMASFEVESE